MKPSSLFSVSLGGSAVFRWMRRSCPDDEGHFCCLGHGDILVMDGRCQDKFLFIVRILVGNRKGSTLRSVGSNNMLPPVPLFGTGVACCLPTCAQGLSVPVMVTSGYGMFWGFSGFSSVSCVLGEC